MADEKFMSALEDRYAFSFDVDQIIHDYSFDKPTLFYVEGRMIASGIKTYSH